MKLKPIVRPNQKDICRVLHIDDDIQVWYQAAKYDITWLQNRRDKIEEVYTKLDNANISDNIFEILGQITSELNSGLNYNKDVSFKQNVLNRLTMEKDDIDWALALGSSSSSSSSLSSSSSSSSSFSFSLSSSN